MFAASMTGDDPDGGEGADRAANGLETPVMANRGAGGRPVYAQHGGRKIDGLFPPALNARGGAAPMERRS